MMRSEHVNPRKKQVRIVSDKELANPLFITDAKSFASKLCIPRRRWIDYLADGYRDAEVELVDEFGNKAWIDFDVIERDHIDLWFREWCKRPKAHVSPRVRTESRERVRLVITILRMMFPKEASVWGQADLDLQVSVAA